MTSDVEDFPILITISAYFEFVICIATHSFFKKQSHSKVIISVDDDDDDDDDDDEHDVIIILKGGAHKSTPATNSEGKSKTKDANLSKGRRRNINNAGGNK
jgi:hypothetical protein